jgi:hypothetical protein
MEWGAGREVEDIDERIPITVQIGWRTGRRRGARPALEGHDDTRLNELSTVVRHLPSRRALNYDKIWMESGRSGVTLERVRSMLSS